MAEHPTAAGGPLVAERLARFAAELDFEKIPGEARERAKLLLLDAIGIAFASTTFDFARSARDALVSFDSGDRAVIGMDTRLALRDAVLMNGVLVHGLDYDDTHLEGVIHVSASCFPCALAVASRASLSGRDFLTVYILGIEAAARLGKVSAGRLLDIGFHPTGMLAAFSSALIAGRLNRLTPDQLVMAQGIALSTMTSASRQFNQEAAWTKRLHPGWGAVGGITAAALARHGFVGPRAAYEGKYGLFPLHLGALMEQCRLEAATASLGEVWETLRVAVKPIPACHLVHGCSDAAIALVRKHGIKPAEVASIRALVPAAAVHVVCEPVARRRRPASSYAAQFSIHYAVACSMVRGRFGFRELEPDAYTDPEILALADKVEYEVDPNSGHPRYFSGEVIVKTTDGRELSHRESINRGAADRPLTAEDVVAKFMDNATLAVSPERAGRVRDTVLKVESCGSISDFENLLAGANRS